MKKALIFSVCLGLVISLSGCSKADSSEVSKEESSSSAAASQEDNVELLKRIDDQQKLIDEQSKKLDKAEEILNKMFAPEGTQSVFSEDFDINELSTLSGDVHPIYDDTAVVEAYKSGDDSKLTDDKDKFILKTATKAIKDNIKDKMTDFEKEKAIYDYVFSQGQYDEGNLAAIPHTADYSHTPYGVLHDHTAICVGNATTFKLFMDMLGIDCKIIHSTETGEHAWNMVKLDDEWYHVDVTFDGGSAKPAYSQFNVTDETKEQAGYPWSRDEFPEAKSVKYNFAVMNAKKVDSFYDTAALFQKAIKDKKQFCYFKLKLTDTEKKTEGVAYYYNSIMSEIGYQIGGGVCDCNAIQGFVNDGYYYGGISIVYAGEYQADPEDEGQRYDFSSIQLDYGKLYDSYLNTFGVSIDTSLFSTEYYGNG